MDLKCVLYISSKTCHIASPSVNASCETPLGEMRRSPTSATQVELLTYLTERVVIILGGKNRRSKHPPAYVVDAVGSHALKGFVSFP